MESTAQLGGDEALSSASTHIDEELCFVIRTKSGSEVVLEARTIMETFATVEGLELLGSFPS